MLRPYDIVKRLMDLVVSMVGLLLIGWLIAAIYLLTRLSSRGPGLFVQQRVGLGGRPFPLVKFRTMRGDHVHNPDPTIVIDVEHEAVTPVGRALRRWRLDELPQLLNVLAGHMSLVGPRPTVPEQVEKYDAFRRRRLEVLPGITGLAQVSGGTGLTWDERIEWDVYYVDHRSPWLDVRILGRTVVGCFRGPERVVRKFADERAAGRLP